MTEKQKRNRKTPQSDAGASKKKSIQLSFGFAEMFELLKNALIQGKDFLVSLEKQIEMKIASLVKKGEISEEDGADVTDEIKIKIRSILGKINDSTDKAIQKTLKALHIISVQDLKALEDKLDSISARLDKLAGKSPAKRAPSKNSGKPRTRSRKNPPAPLESDQPVS
jgi:polyhydroxyalkanoate synthesis regulator phasin